MSAIMSIQESRVRGFNGHLQVMLQTRKPQVVFRPGIPSPGMVLTICNNDLTAHRLKEEPSITVMDLIAGPLSNTEYRRTNGHQECGFV